MAATAIITDNARTVPNNSLLSIFSFHLLSQLMNNCVPIIEKQLSLKTVINMGEGQTSVPAFVRMRVDWERKPWRKSSKILD